MKPANRTFLADNDYVDKRIQKLISIGCFLISASLMPTLSYDAVTVPKIMILYGLSFALLTLLVLQKTYNKKFVFRICASLVLFLIGLIFAFLYGDTNWQIQLYGVVGRGTGLLTYISLTIVFLAAAIVSSEQFAKYLVNALLYSGYLAVIFGMIQFFGLDPIPWENPNNSIITMFGNPNFASAHLGICTIVIFPLLLRKQKLSINFLSKIIFVLIAIFLCIVSDSSQGLLLISLLVPLIIFIKVIRLHKKSLRKWIFLVFYGFFLFTGLLAFFNRGILSPIIYQSSFQHRQDMWAAAIAMIKANPLHGVGLDSYGFFYREFRNESNVSRWGLGNISDSAHNVFLDFASNGGIPLLLGYLIVVLVVFWSGVKLIAIKNKISDFEVSIIFGALAYLVQSFFSINQLGIAIWGWAFGGYILGCYLKFNNSIHLAGENVEPRRENYAHPNKDLAPLFLSWIGLCVGLLISLPLAVKDFQFRNALVRGDGIALEKVLSNFPRNTEYYVVAAKAYSLSDIDDYALKTALAAVRFNKRDFDSWLLILENPISANIQKNEAKFAISKIDPFYRFNESSK